MEGKSIEGNEKNSVKLGFDDPESAIQFLKDFWMAVDGSDRGVGVMLAKKQEIDDFLGERTKMPDRAVLQNKHPSGYTLDIYSNASNKLLSERAREFLRSRDLI